ncbi:MAG TPA: hypothetical protein VIO38_07220 [Rariglobus sp.]
MSTTETHLPVDAIEAVAYALNPGDWEHMNEATRAVEMQTAARILSDAVPHIREQVARDIEADQNHDAVRNATLATAARIARGGKRHEIEACEVTIADAGRTEVTPGTLTAGASWEDR